MKRYLPYVKRYWYCFLLGPLFMIAEACGEFLLPAINAKIIDVGAANGDLRYILGPLTNSSSIPRSVL